MGKSGRKDMKDKIFTTLSGLFFLIFFVGVTAVALENPLRSGFIRAKNAVPHPIKSAVFIFPQIGKIGAEGNTKKPDKITISILLRDASANPIPNFETKLAAKLTQEAPPDVLTITPNETKTNDNGIALFTVTSKKSGKAEFTVIDLKTNTPIDIQSIPTVEFIE